jgi:hypothetical protein
MNRMYSAIIQFHLNQIDPSGSAQDLLTMKGYKHHRTPNGKSMEKIKDNSKQILVELALAGISCKQEVHVVNRCFWGDPCVRTPSNSSGVIVYQYRAGIYLTARVPCVAHLEAYLLNGWKELK